MSLQILQKSVVKLANVVLEYLLMNEDIGGQFPNL